MILLLLAAAANHRQAGDAPAGDHRVEPSHDAGETGPGQSLESFE